VRKRNEGVGADAEEEAVPVMETLRLSAAAVPRVKPRPCLGRAGADNDTAGVEAPQADLTTTVDMETTR
jgi:hypothetical protein